MEKNDNIELMDVEKNDNVGSMSVEKKLCLQELLVAIVTIYTIMFPTDVWNIKELLLAISIIFGYPAIKKKWNEKRNFLFFFFSLIYPSFMIVLSMLLGNSSAFKAIEYSYMWIFLLLIPIIRYYNIDFVKYFCIATTIIAILTNLIYLLDYFGLVSIFSNPIVLFFSKMKEMRYGKGTVSTFGYSIFFKSCPLVVFTYAYALKKKKWMWSAVLFFSLLASGTRANMIIAFIETISILLLQTKKEKRLKIIVILTLISIIISEPIFVRMKKLNEIKKDRSDIYRYSAIENIFENLNTDALNYVFGTGLGSTFYFGMRDKYVEVVEVSYFDYFRQVGIVGFILTLRFLLIPIIKLKKQDLWITIAYIGYLAIAFTNPLLITSTAFMGYVLVYSGCLSDDGEALI